MKSVLTLLTIILLTINVSAQDKHLIDSLETQLKRFDATKIKLGSRAPAMYDSTAADILYELSRAYWGVNFDTSLYYANKCMNLSEKIGYKKGIGNAYSTMGVIDYNQNKYLPAIDAHKKALKIRQEIGDKKGIAGSYQNIGSVYRDQGKNSEALQFFFDALKINEEMGNKDWQRRNLESIAIAYGEQNNFSDALKYFFDALKISEEVGTKSDVASMYGNIGAIYSGMANFPEALRYQFLSLKMAEELDNKDLIASCYVNIGYVYLKQGKYEEALKNHLAALKINQESGNKDDISFADINVGADYLYEKKYNEASHYLNEALTLGKEVGHLVLIKSGYEWLAKLDSAQGNYKEALENYKLWVITRDSLTNTETTKKEVALQMNYDFGKKQDSIDAVQARKDAVAAVEIKKQRQQKYGFIIGLAIMLVFAGVFFRQRNNIKKGKKRSDELLLNILPEEVAEELKEKGSADAKMFDDVTVMFTDFKGFTTIAEKLSAKDLVGEINYCFSAFDNIIHKYGIEKIKTIGDSYMAVGGLPVANTTHAKDVVNAALEINKFMEEHKQQRMKEGKEIFEIRIGIHTGPVVAGIVGIKKFAYDIWGDTVNLASRMESSGEAGKVNISGSTYELIKNDFTCTYRGKIQAKNKGEVDMYFVS